MQAAMSRMPCHILYSSRYAFRGSIFVAAIATVLLFSPTAHADPHAVFYTDRAQEQVFFNTLAALNQADFVEPGIPGQPYSRTDLLARRTNAAIFAPNPTITPAPVQGSLDPNQLFAGETNPLITETKTDLPALLTRNITLEGSDLWTSYLVHQLALETKSRRSASELGRILCSSGFGKAGCSTGVGKTQQEQTAFVKNAQTYSPESLALVGGLSSGTDAESGKDGLRNKITTTPNQTLGNSNRTTGDPTAPATLPLPNTLKTLRPNDEGIAQFRDINKNDPAKLEIINNTTASVIGAHFNSDFPSHALDNITINKDNGNIEIPDNISGTEYLKIASNIGSILPATIKSAERSLALGEEARANREDTSSLATTVVSKDITGGVSQTIKAPSTGKEAIIQAMANLLVESSINQKSAADDEVTIPGTNPALRRERVAGVATYADAKQREGQVAGIADVLYGLYEKYYSQPDTTTKNTPTTGLIPPHEETGLYEVLQALTGEEGIRENPERAEATCGFCVDLELALNPVTQTVGGIVNGVTSVFQGIYNDLICAVSPTLPSCTTSALKATNGTP